MPLDGGIPLKSTWKGPPKAGAPTDESVHEDLAVIKMPIYSVTTLYPCSRANVSEIGSETGSENQKGLGLLHRPSGKGVVGILAW